MASIHLRELSRDARISTNGLRGEVLLIIKQSIPIGDAARRGPPAHESDLPPTGA